MKKLRLPRNASCIGLLLCAMPAFGAGTAANTQITNTATVNFTNSVGATQAVASNPVSFRVDELLNLTLVNNDAGNITVASPDNNRALSFTLTNTGNGVESFALLAVSNVAGDQFDPTLVSIYIDADGDGLFNPAIDTLYVAGSNDPSLTPDQTAILFLVSDIPSALNNGDIGLASLTASSNTGVGAPGTVLGGAGTAGVDAIVGTNGGDDVAVGGYVVSGANVTLVKSFSVLDPFGTANPVPGAIVTYTLVLNAVGGGTLPNTQITDPIPANTTYVPNSVVLESVAQTDAPDSDAGSFDSDSNAVNVVIGTLPVPATRTVTFKVQVN